VLARRRRRSQRRLHPPRQVHRQPRRPDHPTVRATLAVRRGATAVAAATTAEAMAAIAATIAVVTRVAAPVVAATQHRVQDNNHATTIAASIAAVAQTSAAKDVATSRVKRANRVSPASLASHANPAKLANRASRAETKRATGGATKRAAHGRNVRSLQRKPSPRRANRPKRVTCPRSLPRRRPPLHFPKATSAAKVVGAVAGVAAAEASGRIVRITATVPLKGSPTICRARCPRRLKRRSRPRRSCPTNRLVRLCRSRHRHARSSRRCAMRWQARRRLRPTLQQHPHRQPIRLNMRQFRQQRRTKTPSRRRSLSSHR